MLSGIVPKNLEFPNQSQFIVKMPNLFWISENRVCRFKIRFPFKLHVDWMNDTFEVLQTEQTKQTIDSELKHRKTWKKRYGDIFLEVEI